MSLREAAEKDLAHIMEDAVCGFGWDVVLRAPDGATHTEPLKGLTTDIAQAIDSDTGQVVSGRTASVALRVSSLYALGFKIPVGVVDSVSNPWVVKFNDINGKPYTFKIFETTPDRALGLVVCMLEIYEEATP